MSYQQDIIEQTEITLARLRQKLSSSHQGYRGLGLYTQSKPGAGKIVMAVHGEEHEDDLMRVDRHVLYRELSPENSIAAAAYFSEDPIDGPSYMFPDQHYCIHMRIRDSRDRIWMVQHIFDRNAPIPSRDTFEQEFYTLAETQTLINELDKIDIDTARIKDAYAPNAVLVYCDINNSKDWAHTIGFNRFEDFCRAFRHNLLDPLARQHGGYAVKYEGDGLSVCFPFDDKASQREKTRQALSFIKNVEQKFTPFVSEHEKKLKSCSIKIAADIGEVFTYHLPRSDRDPAQTPIRIDHAGDVFITVRQALETAPRHENTIAFGSAFMAYLDEHPYMQQSIESKVPSAYIR